MRYYFARIPQARPWKMLFSLMTNRKPRPLQTLCLITAACLTASPAALSQSASTAPAAAPPAVTQADIPSMTFAVASIRQSQEADSYIVSGSFVAPGTFRATNLTLQNLLYNAYGSTGFYQVSGIPDSMGWKTMFNIEAKADDTADEKLAKLTKQEQSLEQQHMLQQLLADRFHLKMHWSTKEGDVYDLVVRNPSRLHESNGALPSPEELQSFGNHPIPPLYQRGDSNSGFDFVAHGCTVADIVEMLSYQFHRPVIDKTGLHSKYDFVLHYYQTRTTDRDPNDTNPLHPLEEAIQDQLGLKLESDKGPVKTLVVDHVEKPSAN